MPVNLSVPKEDSNYRDPSLLSRVLDIPLTSSEIEVARAGFKVLLGREEGIEREGNGRVCWPVAWAAFESVVGRPRNWRFREPLTSV